MTIEQIVKAYAHDFRDMKIGEIELTRILMAMTKDVMAEMERQIQEDKDDHIRGDVDQIEKEDYAND